MALPERSWNETAQKIERVVAQPPSEAGRILAFGELVPLLKTSYGREPEHLLHDSFGYRRGLPEGAVEQYIQGGTNLNPHPTCVDGVVYGLFIQEKLKAVAHHGDAGRAINAIWQGSSFSEMEQLVCYAIQAVSLKAKLSKKQLNKAEMVDYALGNLYAHRHGLLDLPKEVKSLKEQFH